MNKKGILIPTLAIALMGLVVFAVVIRNQISEGNTLEQIGFPSIDLIDKDQFMEGAIFYYEQRIKQQTLKSFDSFLSKGEEWDENPYDSVKEEIKEELRKELKFEPFGFFELKGDYDLEIVKEENSFLVKVNFEEPLFIDFNKLGEDGEVIKTFYNKTFETEVKVNFGLKLLDRLYNEYSEWRKGKKCESDNWLFEGMEMSCVEEGDFLNFKVITKDLGYVKPEIKFKIRKTGELFS